MTDVELTDFLTRAAQLTPAEFSLVRKAGREFTPRTRSAARKAAKLSAARFSALERQVGAALAPLRAHIGATPDGALSAAIGDTLLAAHGILARHTLTADQYRALVGPFDAVGVDIPEFTAP